MAFTALWRDHSQNEKGKIVCTAKTKTFVTKDVKIQGFTRNSRKRKKIKEVKVLTLKLATY